MKSDSSRFTFDPRKHFSGVRMQQGRVQLDADSIEQIDIVNNRVNTEAADVIGLCGAPMHNAGFQIQAAREEKIDERIEGKAEAKAEASAEEGNEKVSSGARKILAQSATGSESLDFLIGAGRYYVDGILCQNEQPISYLDQDTLADLPAPDPLGKGFYIVYLDVWERLLTAIDDPSIREIALGGPDTAARTKTIWQVNCWKAIDDKGNPLDKVNCLTTLPGFDRLIESSSVQLAARPRREKPTTDACIVSPGGGFTGLENQLYRIEIHDGGQAVDISKAGTVSASKVPSAKNQIVVNGTWKRGQAIEIFASKPGDNLMSGTLAHIIEVDAERIAKPKPVLSSKKEVKALAVEGRPPLRKGLQTLTLDIDVSTLPQLSVREADATFKWSRDNGVVVTTVETITGQKITVHDLGPDDTLGFKEGQWVELIDDTLELKGKPGELGQITNIDSAIKEVTLSFSPTLTISSDPTKSARHPKLRRWDGVGAVKYNAKTPDDSFIDLESSVQVQFSAGQVRTGDYWTIPARTATADTQSGVIEWPQDAGKNPLSQLPFGIKHHYCRLAVVQCSSRIEEIQDCRKIFPPITELTTLRYVGGDGQEAMPGHPQPQPLQVGVFNGSWPVPGATVSFTASDGGQLTPDTSGLPKSMPKGTSPIAVLTDANGVASCAWTLDRNVTKPSQHVEARLLDANGDPTTPRVRFNGNLSIADEVFYDPGECGTLREQGTVQMALSRLSELRSLYKISGDGWEIMPGEKRAPLTLKVLVASPCGPVTDDKFPVTFRIVGPEKEDRSEKGDSGGVVRADGGEAGKSSSGVRGKDGFWTCSWEPDDRMPFQEVEASIKGDDERRPTTPPTTVRFSLNLSTADHVAYTRGACNLLKGSDTVQKAIDQLALATSLYEVSDNNQEVMPGKSVLELKVLAANKCGPVRDQRISFKVISGEGKVESAEVVTKEDGMATTLWAIGPRDQQNQQVEARFTDSKVPIAPPSSVLFNAYFSQAGNVLYDPDPKACPDLAKARVTTVQAALDALCQRKEEAIQAGKVFYEPDPKACPDLAKAKVTTVQAALDALCQRKPEVEGIQAGKVFYDPDPKACPDLARAKVTTVQAALDALCQRKTEDKPPEEGIHILDVKTISGSLRNDTLLPVESLADGVAIVCDQSLAPSIAYGNPDSKSSFPLVAPKPTCFLTLDLPSQLDIFGNSLGNGPGTFGFHPLILASYVRIVPNTNDKEIRCFPTSAAITWLRTLFGPNSALNKFTDRVLAHLTLKGNFIVSAPTAAEMWLDGEAFAVRSSKPTDPLNLRYGGDGRRGGDFEMWFWLVPRVDPIK